MRLEGYKTLLTERLPNHRYVLTNQRDVVTGMTVISMTLKWYATPGEATPIMAALQTLTVSMRAEPGCTGCSLSSDIGTRVEIRYVANWESERDLQRQIRSRSFTQLAELLERATNPPSIEFALPTGTYGLEYAELVRQQKNTW